MDMWKENRKTTYIFIQNTYLIELRKHFKHSSYEVLVYLSVHPSVCSFVLLFFCWGGGSSIQIRPKYSKVPQGEKQGRGANRLNKLCQTSQITNCICCYLKALGIFTGISVRTGQHWKLQQNGFNVFALTDMILKWTALVRNGKCQWGVNMWNPSFLCIY